MAFKSEAQGNKGLALDLFCGAGGASLGLSRAGFTVHGVDIDPQPNYPFYFMQVNAFEIPLAGYDFIWASPPCQGFTAYKRRPNHVKPRNNLIPQVRKMLRALGKPYVIENVPGAPLESPFTLCGSMSCLRQYHQLILSLLLELGGIQMAFKSEAQRRKFQKLVKDGKLDKKILDAFEDKTPKDVALPERVPKRKPKRDPALKGWKQPKWPK